MNDEKNYTCSVNTKFTVDNGGCYRGKDLQPDYLNSLNYNYNKPSCANEVACSLSHQLIYKTIINSDIEWAIILEDDAILDAQLSYLIHELENGKTSLLKRTYLFIRWSRRVTYETKYFPKLF